MKKKRKKYNNMEEDWGMSGIEQADPATTSFLYSGLEGVRRQIDSKDPSKSRRDVAQVEAAKMSRKITEWSVWMEDRKELTK